MTTVYVLKSVITDEDEDDELPIFRALTGAKAFAEDNCDVSSGDWKTAPGRWTNVGFGDEVSISEIAVSGDVVSEADQSSVLAVRFNTYHERDLFLGVAWTLDAAKTYAEKVIDGWFKDDVSAGDRVSAVPREPDGSVAVVWKGEECLDDESVIAVIGDTDALACVIERTVFLDDTTGNPSVDRALFIQKTTTREET